MDSTGSTSATAGRVPGPPDAAAAHATKRRPLPLWPSVRRRPPLDPPENPIVQWRPAYRHAVSRRPPSDRAGTAPEPAARLAGTRPTRFGKRLHRLPACGAGTVPSFMSGQASLAQPESTTNATEFACPDPAPTPTNLRRAELMPPAFRARCISCGPDQDARLRGGCHAPEWTDNLPADFRPGHQIYTQAPASGLNWLVITHMGSVHVARCGRDHPPCWNTRRVASPGRTESSYDLARAKDARPWCLNIRLHPPAADPICAPLASWTCTRKCDHLHPGAGLLPTRDHDPTSQAAYSTRTTGAQFRHHRR